MNDDHDNLEVVAVFSDPTEAALARNLLESTGIRAVLGDQNSASLGWVLTGADGGIKLLVAQADALRSRYLLNVRPSAESDDQGATVDEATTSIATAETLEQIDDELDGEAEEEPLTVREQQATRALKCAVFGFLVPPLLVYALFLVGSVCFTRGRLQGRPRMHAAVAAVILLSAIMVPLLFLGAALLAPPPKKPGLRDFAHPPVLVGKWQGTNIANPGKTVLVLDLDAKGELHFRSTGAAELECTGSWAFDNFTLYVQFEHVLHGTAPQPAAVIGWEMEKFVDDELFLKEEIGMLKLVRQR